MTDQGSTNGAHGGVGHLLRMAKNQCGVTLAFAALRKADGGFAIATFPTLTADPTWSVEAIDELVRQTWDDPHLTGGSVLVRSGRVLKGMWTGQGHHIKLAAAALSDPESPEQPWGLLCVAEPLAGHFEQDQLNLLGNLAIRLTAYLRARQQVLEGSLAFEASAPYSTHTEATPEPAYEPMVETPMVAEAPRTISESTAPFVGFDEPAPRGPFDDLFDDEEAEHPLDLAADAYPPMESAWGSTDRREARSDDWEFLGLDEIEWVEAAAPTPPPTETPTTFEPLTPPSSATFEPTLAFETSPIEPAAPTEPAAESSTSTFGTRADQPTPPTAPAMPTELDSLLGPDPITGLASLTMLVGRLSTSLAHVRNNEGTVGLILFEVQSTTDPGPLTTTAVMTVAGRLTNHLRDRDVVARIGPTLFAVLVDLRPGAVELTTIRDRSLQSLTGGTETGGLHTRVSMVSASAGSTVSAEDLLRQAADQLRTQ
jgi:GGDEF domain-containing protein